MPTEWRPVLETIVDAVARGQLEAINEVPGVDALDPEVTQQIREATEAFGDDLGNGVALLPSGGGVQDEHRHLVRR